MKEAKPTKEEKIEIKRDKVIFDAMVKKFNHALIKT
jgi:hypothetical protein